jgi:hypothetical protein
MGLRSSGARHNVGIVESTCTISSPTANLRALIRGVSITRSIRARRSVLGKHAVNGP